MKLELYKAYKTKEGNKAVAVNKDAHGNFLIWHKNTDETLWHNSDGYPAHRSWAPTLQIIEEWSEPRTFEVTVGIGQHPDGRLFVLTSIDTPFQVIGDHKVFGLKKITITEGEGL